MNAHGNSRNSVGTISEFVVVIDRTARLSSKPRRARDTRACFNLRQQARFETFSNSPYSLSRSLKQVVDPDRDVPLMEMAMGQTAFA